MLDQSISLLLALLLANVILVIIITVVGRDISSKTSARILEIENEKQFIERIQISKQKVEASMEQRLIEKISIRKEYLIQDAIRRSASVTKGKIIEHFAPFMLTDVLSPDEMVFIGSPIDLISFTGIDEQNDISIDFLEIKTGNSTLNRKQKLIREAVFSKRIYYKEVHLND